MCLNGKTIFNKQNCPQTWKTPTTPTTMSTFRLIFGIAKWAKKVLEIMWPQANRFYSRSSAPTETLFGSSNLLNWRKPLKNLSGRPYNFFIHDLPGFLFDYKANGGGFDQNSLVKLSKFEENPCKTYFFFFHRKTWNCLCSSCWEKIKLNINSFLVPSQIFWGCEWLNE